MKYLWLNAMISEEGGKHILLLKITQKNGDHSINFSSKKYYV